MIELSELKDYLGLNGSATYDALLKTLIGNVSDWIEGMVGRKLRQSTITEYHDGGGREIALENFPIISVTSVKWNAGTQNTPIWTDIDPESYIKVSRSGVIKSISLFPTGDENIEIVYVAGYAVIPGDLQLLAKELVGRIFNQRKAQGMSEEIMGSSRIMWNTELTSEQKDILAGYQKFRV